MRQRVIITAGLGEGGTQVARVWRFQDAYRARVQFSPVRSCTLYVQIVLLARGRRLRRGDS
jgi:hypothetical protein